MQCLKFLRSAAQETAEVNFPQKSSLTLSSKEIAMLYSVHLGIFTIMSNHLVSSFFSPEILKKNEVWSCNHDTKASQNCPKGFTRYLKFIYSEKATKFCEISTIDFSYVVPVKSAAVEILQNFVAFSEYMNFTVSSSRNRKAIHLYCNSRNMT